MSRDSAPPESDRAANARAPRQTTGLFGHAHAEAGLLAAYRSGKLAQAWLIGGPEGIGKATLAWRMARFLLAHPDPQSGSVQSATDLFVPPEHAAARKIAAASHGDVFTLRREWNEKTKKHFTEIRADDVRQAIHLFQQASGEGGWRICILDCAEDLNRSSANALLKMIEEPPPRSLFLIIAQKPGQVLPTIRSRCRKLMLAALDQDSIVKAVQAQGPPLSGLPIGQLAQAAARAGGSAREALRLIDGGSLAFDRRLQALLGGLPRIDWRAVHALADDVAGRERDEAYETMKRGIFEHLAGAVRSAAAARAAPASLVPLAQAWDKINGAVREAEALNLDRRALVLGIFGDLAAAG